jgi:Kef-type K+ transport system membrane component KefB
LLSIAIGLNTGSEANFAKVLAVFLGGVVAALAISRVLRHRWLTKLAARHVHMASSVIAIGAVILALSVERLGLTSIFGAVLVGLAIPYDLVDFFAGLPDRVRPNNDISAHRCGWDRAVPGLVVLYPHR